MSRRLHSKRGRQVSTSCSIPKPRNSGRGSMYCSIHDVQHPATTPPSTGAQLDEPWEQKKVLCDWAEPSLSLGCADRCPRKPSGTCSPGSFSGPLHRPLRFPWCFLQTSQACTQHKSHITFGSCLTGLEKTENKAPCYHLHFICGFILFILGMKTSIWRIFLKRTTF